MKYEFHAGDYVEAFGGFVGWICQIKDDYIWVANKDIGPFGYRIPEDLKYFNRIGQYDFTKKDKAEMIAELTYFDETAMLWKINELVKAVNELRAAQNGVE